MQQDNGPEHSSESTSKWLKGFGVGYTKPIFKLNLDFFWHDLKQPPMVELKQFCYRRVGQNFSTVMHIIPSKVLSTNTLLLLLLARVAHRAW